MRCELDDWKLPFFDVETTQVYLRLSREPVSTSSFDIQIGAEWIANAISDAFRQPNVWSSNVKTR